jgi:hypothetical protein
MRVTAGSWEGEKVFARSEVLEVRNVDGPLHVARKPRHHDEWDPPITPYDPYDPGTDVSADVDFVSGDETGVSGDAGA